METAVPEVFVSQWMSSPLLRPGRPVFAIGDVHGQAAAFKALLDAMSVNANPESCLILLGDIIDRGPASVETIAIAHACGAGFGSKEWLLGNHDLFFHACAVDRYPEAWEDRKRISYVWYMNGGEAFLDELDVYDPFRVREALVKRLGESIVRAYEAAKSHCEIGNILFVHAGIHPSASLADWFSGPKFSTNWLDYEDDHWAWIRADFYMATGRYKCNRFVVHGHTPEVYIMRRKGLPVPGLPAMQNSQEVAEAFLDQVRVLHGGVPLHQVDGWRLGLDGSGWPVGMVTGAEIQDGRYRIYMSKTTTP